MKTIKNAVIFLVTFGCLLLATVSFSDSSNSGYRIIQDRLNSGGNYAFSQNVISTHSGGQPVSGQFTTASNHMNAGFFHFFHNTIVTSGDLNLDGVVDLTDVITGLKMLTGAHSNDVSTAGEIDGDGKIGMEEILFDLNHISE